MCLKLKQNLVVARCGIVVLDLLPPSHFVKQETPLHAPCASNPHHLLLAGFAVCSLTITLCHRLKQRLFSQQVLLK